MISLFFIEFIRVGGGERFRIDDSQSLDFIYDTASFFDASFTVPKTNILYKRAERFFPEYADLA